MKKCNKFILTSLILLSLFLSCKLFQGLGNKSSLSNETTQTTKTTKSKSLDKLVFSSSGSKNSSGANIAKLASSSNKNKSQNKPSLDSIDKDSLVQNQSENQQEIALKNEIEKKLSSIEHDALIDISKIDDKIASLEALQKQLEKDLEKDLSNQTHLNKSETENVAAKAQTNNQEEQKGHNDSNKENDAVADSKKDAFIKETIEAIKKKIEEEKKRKAFLEEQERQKQQELDQIKAQHEEEKKKREEEKRKRKEKKDRHQKFMQITSDLNELVKMAELEAYSVSHKLKDLEKGIENYKNNNNSNKDNNNPDKDTLNKSLKDIIYEITKLSSLIEAKEKINERKKLGFQTEKEFDDKFATLKQIKDILKALCGKAKGHLGGNLDSVTVDGITKENVDQATLIIKLIQKTLIYINESKSNLTSILEELKRDAADKINKIKA
ncbi:hypothetical protein [Borrelia sp. A-FGy1]|uniref:hypothetical protein n=1 Tax=Borrelia sp. A-FGy1 TaxID=2608247 RepID=UPI001E34F55D|nr:hypothetical protein [Borrelia sp. A-FGy1]